MLAFRRPRRPCAQARWLAGPGATRSAGCWSHRQAKGGSDARAAGRDADAAVAVGISGGRGAVAASFSYGPCLDTCEAGVRELDGVVHQHCSMWPGAHQVALVVDDGAASPGRLQPANPWLALPVYPKRACAKAARADSGWKERYSEAQSDPASVRDQVDHAVEHARKAFAPGTLLRSLSTLWMCSSRRVMPQQQLRHAGSH